MINIYVKIEDYLADFSNTVNLLDFVINLIVATLLALILKHFYMRFGMSVSNREKFATNFVPLALATMMVITVVQASIALSLGLVGALSIVRFRAAIKEPEELTYLFLVIGIGLVTGANKPILATIAILLILVMLFINKKFKGGRVKSQDTLFVNVQTIIPDLEKISSIAENAFAYIELRRADITEESHFVSFLSKATSVSQLEKFKKEILSIDPKAKISFIDQPDLIL